MREILFRGKRMDNGDWVEGYYFERKDTLDNIIESVIIDDAYEQIIAGQKYVWSKLNKECFRVDYKTVGQFTGLTDKNGKKIFEGDILSIARKMDGMGTYYVPTLAYPVNVEVKWDFCGWMWETLCEDKRYLHFPEAWCHFECEIIGNIHDNPELLWGAEDG